MNTKHVSQSTNGIYPVRSKFRHRFETAMRLVRASNGMSPVRSRGRLSPRPTSNGMSTLELLIAITILTLAASAAITVAFGGQSVSLDIETNSEAITKATTQLETERALSRSNFAGIVSATIPPSGGSIYTTQLAVADLTPCLKQVTSTISWTTEALRPQKVSLSSELGDVSGTIAMGGDCATQPPSSNWSNPQRFASDTLIPGKSTAIDALNRIAYFGSDKAPFLAIADTRNATLGQSSGLFVTFTNGFNLGAVPNAIDAIAWHDSMTGAVKYYVFAAMNTASNQFEVVDVTDITKPSLVATRSLSSCVAGSYPEGWRMYYYSGKLYFTTRFTAGPEFHIFDVTLPTNPSEIAIGSAGCKGLDLGDTVNGIAVQDQVIGGVTKRFAYFATDESNKELRVFNVTDPLNITEVTAANQDLPGAQNGLSVFPVGNKLYFGRQSTPSGNDLYIYNISNPPSGLTLLGSQDINTGALEIRVAGRFAFIATPKANAEFQIWDILNPPNISLIKSYNFGNIVSQGIDYEPDYIYSTGQTTPNFQILYSP